MKDTSGEKRYTYDDANRLTKIVQGPVGFVENTDHNYKLEYAWNAASQLTQIKKTVRTLSALQWDLAYTDDGQLNTITNPDSEVTKFEYLEDGRIKKITYRNGSANKTTREFFYQDTSDIHAKIPNKQKFLRKLLDKDNSGTTIASFVYELDLAGNRLGVTDKDNKYTRLISDPSLQLRTETKWSSKTSTSRNYQYGFAYDENGNRLTQHKDGVLTNYTYGDNNEILTAGSDTFTQDIFGNIATKVNGGNTTTYSYNFERNLTGIDYPATSNDDSHQYDGDGVRMRSKLNGASDWTNFIQCPVTGVLLGEYTLISSTYSITSVNTWGLGLISTNRGGTKRYFHFDGNGSTVALTEASGSVTDTYSYSGFGVTESSTGTNVNPFRFMGELGAYSDGAMGSQASLVQFNGNYYSPIIGGFPGPKGRCFLDCLDRSKSIGYGDRQSCWFCKQLCNSTAKCDNRTNQPKFGSSLDACIHFACALKIAREMYQGVIGSDDPSFGGVREIIDKIQRGKTMKTALTDCIKEAKARRGWVYRFCGLFGGTIMIWPMCAEMFPNEASCLACCNRLYPIDSGGSGLGYCEYRCRLLLEIE